MAFGFEYFDADGTTTAEGVFIPQSDLLGVEASELAAAEPEATKDSKFAYSVMDTFANGAFTGTLGLTLIESIIAGASALVSSKTFSVTTQYSANLADKSVGVIPAPTIGDNVGTVELSIQDIFPNATKLASSASTGSAGVLIPSADIEGYGASAHASIDPTLDSRDWISGLIRFMIDNADLRSDVVASAITAVTNSNATGVALTDVAFDDTNPTTGLDPAERNQISAFSVTSTMTIERVEDRATQSYDVNVVTA